MVMMIAVNQLNCMSGTIAVFTLNLYNCLHSASDHDSAHNTGFPLGFSETGKLVEVDVIRCHIMASTILHIK